MVTGLRKTSLGQIQFSRQSGFIKISKSNLHHIQAWIDFLRRDRYLCQIHKKNFMDQMAGLIKLFRYYRGLGERAMSQVSEDHLFARPDENSNSIAVIVRHLSGNMLSRWTNFRTEDGEKEWRDRDSEFEDPDWDTERLMQYWKEGWDCLENALSNIQDSELNEIVYIRKEGHSIQEAIYRQLAHYTYHVGQIVYLSRMFSESWKSLSIPKNESGRYNSEKFSGEKEIRHFTDRV
jgi:hypothetical protein